MKRIKETVALGALSLADQLVVSGASFVTMYLVSQSCSKAEVGMFALAWTVIGLLRTVQERVIAAPYLAFAFRSGFQRPTYRGSSLIHQAFFAVGMTCVIVLMSLAAMAAHKPQNIWMLILSLSVALPFTLFRDQMRALSSVSFQFAMQLILDLVIGTMQIGGLIALNYLHHFSLSSVNLVLGLACIPATSYWFWGIKKSIAFDANAAWADWLGNWNYSRWLLAARLFGVGGYLAVPWLVSFYLDTAATGAFAVCNNLVGIALVCVTGANNMFQPRTVRELQRHGMTAMLRTLAETLCIIVGALSVISLTFFFFGNFALRSIYGRAYEEYGYLAFLLSLSTLSVSMSIIFGNGLAALGNSKEYFWGEFSCFAVSMVCALLMIPGLGLDGAAYALVFGGLAASIVTGLTLLRGVSRFSQRDSASASNASQLNPWDAGHA